MLVIIGKRPPPIGGVTIHVDRLLGCLDKYEFTYSFYDLKKFSIRTFIAIIIKYSDAHLHSSSPILRFIFTLLCRLFHTTSIITIHGNLGRYSRINNLFDNMTIRFSNYPIVINRQSYLKAITLNNASLLISAYIPSLHEEELESKIVERCKNIRMIYKIVCVTNAYNYSIDKNKNEIYGINELILFFRDHFEYGFIISDPSGNYSKKFGEMPSNILIIDKPHSFIKILQFADCFIRYTSTDGDSLSIHEALDNNVCVIATDIVDRPHGTICIHRGDFDKLADILSSLNLTSKSERKLYNKTNIDNIEIIRFYKKNNFI